MFVTWKICFFHDLEGGFKMEKVIKLVGWINSSNADAVEKEAFRELKDEKIDTIIFDASELHYISSMGLRIILKCVKRYQKVKIINCNDIVRNILEVVGYADYLIFEDPK